MAQIKTEDICSYFLAIMLWYNLEKESTQQYQAVEPQYLVPAHTYTTHTQLPIVAFYCYFMV